MLGRMLYNIFILVFGTLYPTYLSYKALKQKDNQECARLMMYWIVFAIFTFLEGFLDIFIGIWFPFYFESKIIFMFWLISPYGNGAKILYENIVQKKFEQNEKVIDDFISSMKHVTVAIFWKTWSKCSVYANYLLLLSFNKAQIAFIQYMNNQREPFKISTALNSLTSFNTINLLAMEANPFGANSPINPEPSVKEENDSTDNAVVELHQEEEMEQSTMSQVESIKSDDEEPEVKRPGRKTKRKRRVAADLDISNRPITRAAAKSKSQSISDVEMISCPND